jgi:uncharacterized phage protein (TIGR02218 family)
MTGRNVPIQLAANLAEAATSTCRLRKITQIGLAPFGLTTLDHDVEYDDGDGLLTYKAKRGYNTFAIASNADLSVDNSQAEVLIAEVELDGVTAAAIASGKYDGARFVEYLVDYEDLAAGHTIFSSGTIGRIGNVDGLAAVMEDRSLTQTLKQKSIIEKGSNSCRVVEFGDERCQYAVAAEWVDFEVTAVGTETDREFTISGSGVAEDADYYAPGLSEWLTGDNAGTSQEVETYSDELEVVLAIPTSSAVQVGDTGRIRRDCTRLWGAPLTEDHNSCNTFNNREHFRGEPKRPVSETASLMAPGAASTGGGGTTGGGDTEIA